jgi:exonuclease SbcC
MITSLVLKNWRTHAETRLDFGKGTNVIVGVMGSGKSSIVNAISYSLFGTFPQLKSKQITLEETIMNKPNPADKAETIIEFGAGGKKFRVERVIKKDATNEAKLYEENKLVAGPKQKDVNERVEQLLGLNYELFSRAVYSEQNEMDFFLKLTPSERKKKFDELLELQKYEDARKNSITLQNELAKENKQRKEMTERQKESIKQHEEEKLLKQIEEDASELKKLEEEISAARKEMNETEKKYIQLKAKESKNIELEEMLLKNNLRKEQLKEDIEKSEKISVEEVERELKKKREEKEAISAKRTEKEKEQREKDLAVKKLSEEIKVLNYRKDALKNEEKSVLELKGKCPTCKQELTEGHKKEIHGKAEEEIKKILLETEEKNNEKLKISDIFEAVQKERKEMEKQLEIFNIEIAKLEQQEKRSKELETKKKNLEELTKTEPQIRKKIEENGFDKKEMEKERETLFALKTKTSVAETQIKAKLELKKSREETLIKIGSIKKIIEEAENMFNKTESVCKTLGVFANCLEATQHELRQEMLQTTNQAMSSIWQSIYPYRDYTDARLSVTKEGYDLEVMTRNGNWTRVEGILSGGERSAAALCIRIAFALVLTKKLSMLILDEPTHNLDFNAVAKLSAMLREEIPALVEQVFVITHDKQMEEAASSNLYMLTRNKDADETTKIEVLNIEN